MCQIKINMALNYEDIVKEWYNKLRPEFLRRLSLKYSGLTLADAENLYQDAFIAVYDNLSAGKVYENTNWSAYITTIGMNLASKLWRKDGKTNSFASVTEEKDSTNSLAYRVDEILKILPFEEEEPLFKNKNAQALLGEELIHVPEPCNSILFLYYYNNLSMVEIAERTGYKNATTAKSKKSQCMKDLMRRITKAFQREGFLD